LALRPSRYEFDPKKAYQKKQLAELGAISIAWNQVEGQIDHIGSQILFRKSPFYVWLELNDVVGLTGKLRLIRACVSHAEILDEPAKRCIETALQGVSDYRAYRNAVIHHHIYDHKKGIAGFIAENGKAYQVLVTFEALSGLYKRIELLKNEVSQLAPLLMMEATPDLIRIHDPKTGHPELDQRKALRERAVPQATKEVLRYQTERLSLPPLPLFPDARRVRPKTEGAKSRSRPSGKGRAK
jgi:hypothetical protein